MGVKKALLQRVQGRVAVDRNGSDSAYLHDTANGIAQKNRIGGFHLDMRKRTDTDILQHRQQMFPGNAGYARLRKFRRMPLPTDIHKHIGGSSADHMAIAIALTTPDRLATAAILL